MHKYVNEFKYISIIHHPIHTQATYLGGTPVRPFVHIFIDVLDSSNIADNLNVDMTVELGDQKEVVRNNPPA